ncbi:MAG: hypothetical protein PVI50_05615 [Gammaproteobacteria bacterium]
MLIPAGLQKAGVTAIAIALAAWAVIDLQFRDAEQLLTARACLPLAIAAACLVMAWSAGKEWRTSAAWLAVLITGQAAALQLMQPTGHVGYQHYLSPADFGTPAQLFCILLIGIQAGMVVIALAPSRGAILGWLGSNFRAWQLAVIALLASIAASAPSLELLDYTFEFLLAGGIQLLGLLTVIALVRSIPSATLTGIRQRLDSWGLLPACDGEPEPGGIDRFAMLGALWVVALSTLLSVCVYEQHPHIADEVVYLLHANYLAHGMLAMPLPPVPEAFNIDLMIYDQDRWFSAFPPGWPAMLAVGSLLGAPWLVNPLLAGLCVLLAYALSRELLSRGGARLVVLLMCLSPWFIFLAMSFMAHIFTLACVLAAALAIARLRARASLLPAVLAGALLGVTSLIRPLDGLAVAAVLGLWSLGMRSWRDRFIYIPVFVMASLLVGALALPYNHHLTGDPTSFPVMAYFDKYYAPGVNALGFGADRGLDWRGLDPFPGHGLRDVILNNYLNTFAVNVELFGWVTGSLLPLLVLFLAGAAGRADYRLLLVVLVVAGLHSLYWFNGGPDYGARYWFLILLPVIALTVRGACFIGSRLPDPQTRMTQVVTGMLALSIAGTVAFMPWRAVDKYFHYNNMRPDIRQLAQANDFSNGLVLVSGNRFDDYMSAAVYNAPEVEKGSVIYAWDRDSATRTALLEAFGNRRIWLVDGPTVTGAGFRVAAGPLSAAELRQRSRTGIPADSRTGQATPQ